MENGYSSNGQDIASRKPSENSLEDGIELEPNANRAAKGFISVELKDPFSSPASRPSHSAGHEFPTLETIHI